MRALEKDRFKIRELQALVNEMCEGIVDDERDIPKVEFRNLNRNVFGMYLYNKNIIYVNPIWNGVDTAEISYTFLHEFVHFTQYREKFDWVCKSSENEAHDWDFLKRLFKLVLKYGTKEHYTKLLEEVFFYRFKISREKYRKTVSLVSFRRYEDPMEKYYKS